MAITPTVNASCILALASPLSPGNTGTQTTTMVLSILESQPLLVTSTSLTIDDILESFDAHPTCLSWREAIPHLLYNQKAQAYPHDLWGRDSKHIKDSAIDEKVVVLVDGDESL